MSNQIIGMTTSLSEPRRERPISFSGMKVNQVKAELAAQLNKKEELINKAGTSQISRNALIKQTDQIRKELIDLNHFDQEEELPSSLQLKLEDLANEFQYLKNNKPSDFSSLLPPPPTTSSPSKHRSKPLNGSRRNPDIEFATEIGQGLLIEVRKLQVALQEKDEIIKQLELAKADTERNQETTQRHFKQREEIEERLKEENWNLEVANQELRTHLSESNQSVTKLNADYSRLTKQLKTQAEQIDIMKAQEEKSASVVEAMKARHEQETHQLRRHAATAQRENAQIQKQVEALNTELKICKAKLAIKMAASSSIRPDDSGNDSNQDSDKKGDKDDEKNKSLTPPTSPGLSSRNQVMETETLKQSLAHAHRIISNLRSSYHKEKLEKFEIKKMLSDSQENIEQLRKEMASWNNNISPSTTNSRIKQSAMGKKKKKAVGKKRRGGVARQPRGLCLNESSDDNISDRSELEDNADNMTNDEEEEEEGVGAYNYMNREEENSDTDNDYDDMMMNIEPGNTLQGFGFQGTSFSSVPMMPLSSELAQQQQKVQVVDVGVNTEPIVTPDSTSHVVTIGDTVAQQPQLVANETVTGSTDTPVNETVAQKDINMLIKQAVEDALEKRNNEIARNAGSILTPEQIEALVNSQIIDTSVQTMNPSNTTTTKTSSTPTLTSASSSALPSPSTTTTTTTTTKINTIPQAEDKQVDTIPKQEVDHLIQVAVADALQKAQEQSSKELVNIKEELAAASVAAAAATASAQESDRALTEERNRIAETMISKEEAEQLALNSVNEAIEKQKSEHQREMAETMVSKVQLEIAIKEAVDRTRSEMMAEFQEQKLQLQQQIQQIQQEQRESDAKPIKEEEMFTKEEAQALVLEAVTNERLRLEQDIKKLQEEKEMMKLENSAPSKLATAAIGAIAVDEMVTKKEAEELAKLSAASEKERWQQLMDEKLSDLEKEKSSIALEKTRLEQLIEQNAQEALLDKSTALASEKEKLEKVMAEALEKEKSLALTEKEKIQQLSDTLKQEKLAAISEKEKLQQLYEQQLVDISEKEKLAMQSEKDKYQQLSEELEKEKSTLAAEQLRIQELSSHLDVYKKQKEELDILLASMMKKEDADQLVQESIAKALEEERAVLEKIKNEEMADMIPKDDVKLMIEEEVAKALDIERKEVAQREEDEAIEMISKAEASALAKVAAADAIVKERQASAAREAELMTKEEADMLSQTAAREAAEKERNELNAVLTKERKQFREKEERMILKEEAEIIKNNAVQEALEKYKQEQEKKQVTLTEHRNISEYGSATYSMPNESSELSSAAAVGPSFIERSVSTSRLAPPAVTVQLAPSISTPTSSGRSIRSTSSISSLRLGRKDDSKRSANNNSDTIKSSTSSFGSLLIREQKNYTHKLGSKSSASLRELSKQGSVASLSTISSDDHHHHHLLSGGRGPLPMSSDESFAGFSNSSGTDMYVISAITQTMIGEWMLKHTRRYGGRGISDNKHSRFFWVHPYTKTLYWSTIEPGVDGNEAKAKSAFIESVSSIPSNDSTGASPMSLIIKTPKRDLKLTASTLERHEIWFKSLSYLLRRPDANNQIPEEPRVTVDGIDGEGNITLGTRSPESMNVAQYDSDDSDDNIDIRKCCDGKHDISTLSKEHLHHHHH